MKPGYLTTEFYAMIANTILSILVTFNVIDKVTAENVYALIIPLITALLGIVVYIYSRTKVKINA